MQATDFEIRCSSSDWQTEMNLSGIKTNQRSLRSELVRSDVKSRGLIIFAWFLFGKGNFVWVLVAAKLLHDWRPDVIPSPVDMGLFKIGTFI